MSAAQVPVGLRLPEELIKKIDKLAERMSKPGTRVTRSDVIRRAVYSGIDKLDAANKRK